MKMFLVGFVVVGGWLLAGCPVQCKQDSDCDNGRVCTSGSCKDAPAGTSSSSSGGVSSSGGQQQSSSAIARSSSGVTITSSSAAAQSSSSAAANSSSSGTANSQGLVLEVGGIATVGDAWLTNSGSSGGGNYVLTEMGFEGLGIACSDAGMCVTGGITP